MVESYGALRLLDAPLSLVLPFSVVFKALKQGCQRSHIPNRPFRRVSFCSEKAHRSMAYKLPHLQGFRGAILLKKLKS